MKSKPTKNIFCWWKKENAQKPGVNLNLKAYSFTSIIFNKNWISNKFVELITFERAKQIQRVNLTNQYLCVCWSETFDRQSDLHEIW